jgi:hypothetical protein
MTLKPFHPAAFIKQVLETEEHLLIEITFLFYSVLIQHVSRIY